ncbi:rho GTPase-activating protein 6-like [Arapaima gigas]
MGAGRGQAIGRVEAPRPAHLDLGCVQSARARAGRWRRRSPCSARCQTEHHRAAMLAHGIRLRPVPIQSLSELERARLREVASWHLEEKDLECKISIPRETHKRRKSLRKRFDSFSKEKKERGKVPTRHRGPEPTASLDADAVLQV